LYRHDPAVTGEAMMSNFRYRWDMAGGDIRAHFWSDALIAKRLVSGMDSAGRELVKCPVGRILF
jgi:hypothetical protein